MATQKLGHDEMLLIDHTGASASDDLGDRHLCCSGLLRLTSVSWKYCRLNAALNSVPMSLL